MKRLREIATVIGLWTLAGCIEPVSLAPEAGEERAGGGTTVYEASSRSFELSARNLLAENESAFSLGRNFFNDHWVKAPASTTGRDGLGPTYNARSCETCHRRGGRGAPPQIEGGEFESMLLRISIPDGQGGFGPDPAYGGQIQLLAVSEVPGEGTPRVWYVERAGTYPDGQSYSLREPTYSVQDAAFGNLPDEVVMSPRTAPFMFGLGLLEAIDESDLLAYADPDDLDGDGVSGRPNFLLDPIDQQTKLGRFGWKANQIDLHHQNAGAFLGDLGITSALHRDQNCPAPQLDCIAALDGGSPELSRDLLEAVDFYTHMLAVPARRSVGDPTVLEGRERFIDFGCDACHVREYLTSDSALVAELRGQHIWPYTDLLLHDMGEGLADHRPDGEATGVEWRTPPLWGIGLIVSVNGHDNLMHDGRARGFEEAVLWHAGEAAGSREAFANASVDARQQLMRFLGSL